MRASFLQGVTMQVDQDKLNAFMGKFVADIGAAAHGVTVLIGEKLGLFKAMAAGLSLIHI